MVCEDLLVVFTFLLFLIARSKETLSARYGVRGPLLCRKGEECAAKVNCVFVLMGQHRHFLCGGRATFKKSREAIRELDSTRGFPDEDIHPLLRY